MNIHIFFQRYFILKIIYYRTHCLLSLYAIRACRQPASLYRQLEVNEPVTFFFSPVPFFSLFLWTLNKARQEYKLFCFQIRLYIINNKTINSCFELISLVQRSYAFINWYSNKVCFSTHIDQCHNSSKNRETHPYLFISRSPV